MKRLAALLAIAIAIPFSAPAAAGSNLDADGNYIFAKPGDGGRSYVQTSRADYAKGNFQAEVTVTLKGGGGAGCAFFGIGCGQANPGEFQEPSTAPALYVRLAPGDFAGGAVSVSVNGREAKGDLAPTGDGTHRIRLTWDASRQRALFEIDSNWDGQSFRADSSATVDGTGVRFGDAARLFVGGANGVRFTGFATKTLAASDLKKADFGETFAGDPTAGTWLPVAGSAGPANSVAPAVDDFLKSLHGRLRLLGCWYHGAELAASRTFTNGTLRTDGSQWKCNARSVPLQGDVDAIDLELTFKLADGIAKSAGVAVAFDFADWSTHNYVLVPAAVYNGNRCRIVGRNYATGLDRSDLYRKDLPLTSCAIPQLSPNPEKPSKFEVSACNATTPALCFFSPKAKRGFMVLAEQGIRIGDRVIDHGFSVEENADRTAATLVISAPGVRERKPEFIGFSASPDRGINLKTGDEIKLKLRLYSFATPDIPGLLEKFMTVRKAATGANQPRDLLPASKVVDLMTARIDSRFHHGQDFKFYCPENAAWISFGWIGGLMDTFPMLVLGDQIHLDRVTRTFDFAIPRAQGKAGYYYGALNQDGTCFGREGYDEHPEICLTRKNGDVLFWMLKQFMLLKAQGKAAAIKPAWEASMKALADAFVTTWKNDGQWGNFVNIDTGAVAVYNTTGGAIAIGGLALASSYYHNPEYLRVATAAAEFYYQRDFVKQGQTTGACADILQNADSETAAGFMTALTALYETTGDAGWLEKSRNLANLAATWTVSYDYQLPPDCELAKLGAKLAGVVWASTQNKHGAPGFCTSSADSLFKIYRATGDRRYAELLRDVIHAHAEGIQPNGQISERLTYCDADSRGSRGSGSTGWNELNGILMAMEIPGIYVRNDRDEIYVFDPVGAAVVKRDHDGVTLKITNPTRFDAQVAVCTENEQQAQRPLGVTGFLGWRKVAVKSGETILVTLK